MEEDMITITLDRITAMRVFWVLDDHAKAGCEECKVTALVYHTAMLDGWRKKGGQ